MATERGPRTNVLAQLTSYVLSRVLLLGATVVTAKVVGVSQFGSFALALVVYQAGVLLRDAGLGQASIVLGGTDRPMIWTAFIATSSIGAMLAMALVALAGPLTTELGVPSAAPLVVILAVAFAIGSCGVASNASLERELEFPRRAAIDTTSYVILALVTGAGLAVGVGVASLGWGYVAQGAAQTIAGLVMSPPWRNRSITAADAKQLFRYGGILWVSALIAYLTTNVDNVAVARLGGAPALGTYALSYTLGTTITIGLAQVVNRVALPYYARARDAAAANKIANVVVPLSAGLGLLVAAPVITLAPEIRERALGSGAPFEPMALLAVFGVVRAVAIALGTALNGTARPGPVAVFGSVNLVMMIVLIAPGYSVAGLTGVALVVLGTLTIAIATLAWRTGYRSAGQAVVGAGATAALLVVVTMFARDAVVVRVAAGAAVGAVAAVWAWRVIRVRESLGVTAAGTV
jgi:PST family polysaccharide transporter